MNIANYCLVQSAGTSQPIASTGGKTPPQMNSSLFRKLPCVEVSWIVFVSCMLLWRKDTLHTDLVLSS